MAKHIEKIKLNDVVDHWDLNKIAEENLVVEKTIASGGQGKVKIGKYYDMTVIVKILHNLNTRDYTNEVTNVYKYRHPNIPKFLGIYQSEKNYGLLSEHVDGKTLSRFIQMERTGALKLAFVQKIDYMIQLASIIEFLHDHKLIHRDLKPDNIIIDHLGNLKLLDYGIAIHEDVQYIALDSPEFSLTPNYIPPEVLAQTQQSDDEDSNDEEEEDLHSSGLTKNMNKNYASNGSVSGNTGNNLHLGLSTKGSYNNFNDTKSMRNGTTGNTGFNFTKIHPQHTQKQEVKKVVYVSNKFDIWTFGLILAEVMTRCRPWAKNEKDTISDFNISALITRKTPYYVGKILGTEEHTQTITNLIKNCTNYEPTQRWPIKQLKEVLVKIFNKEVNEEKKLRSLQNLQNLSKINTEIKKNLGDMKVNTNDVIRNGKIIQRRGIENKLNAINAINAKNNNNNNNNNLSTNSGTSSTQATSNINNLLLSSINAKNKIIDKKDKDTLENGLMMNLRKIYQNKENKLAILNKKLKEINDKILELGERSDTKTLNVEQSTTFKNYAFMTYDDINSNIIIHEFPKREIVLEKGIMRKLYKDLIKYRNPFCLNYDEKLYMIGGLANSIRHQDTSPVNDSDLTNPQRQTSFETLNHEWLLNTNQALYGELFGVNYSPSNICIFYDPHLKELKLLPILLHARCCASAIVYKQNIYAIGGNTRFCEILDLGNGFNKSWTTVNELQYLMYDPLLMNYNDRYIFALQYDSGSNKCQILQKIKIQIMNLHNDLKWTDESIEVCIQIIGFKGFTYFSGIYYNSENDENNMIYILGNTIKQEYSGMSAEESEKEADIKVPSLFTLKFNIVNDEEDKKYDKFKFEFNDLKDLRFSATNLTSNIGFKVPDLFIHNTSQLYCYDETLTFYTVNREGKTIEPIYIDMPLNEIA